MDSFRLLHIHYGVADTYLKVFQLSAKIGSASIALPISENMETWGFETWGFLMWQFG